MSKGSKMHPSESFPPEQFTSSFSVLFPVKFGCSSWVPSMLSFGFPVVPVLSAYGEEIRGFGLVLGDGSLGFSIGFTWWIRGVCLNHAQNAYNKSLLVCTCIRWYVSPFLLWLLACLRFCPSCSLGSYLFALKFFIWLMTVSSCRVWKNSPFVFHFCSLAVLCSLDSVVSCPRFPLAVNKLPWVHKAKTWSKVGGSFLACRSSRHCSANDWNVSCSKFRSLCWILCPASLLGFLWGSQLHLGDVNNMGWKS